MSALARMQKMPKLTRLAPEIVEDIARGQRGEIGTFWRSSKFAPRAKPRPC